MGIKDVFDRIKGKPDTQTSDSPDDDNLDRRQTGEETIQAPLRAKGPQPDSGGSGGSGDQDNATMIAPAIDRPTPQARHTPVAPQAPGPAPSVNSPESPPDAPKEDATVVAGSSPPPSLRNAGPSPRAPVNPPPSVRPSITPVAPSPNRVAQPISVTPAQPMPVTPTPIPATADAPAANPGVSSPVSSDDATFFQSPDTDNTLELAAVLVGIYGEAKNAIFRLPFGTTTIGRGDDCGVQLLDAKVSRKHATLVCEGETIQITPKSERNPVLVNDEPIASSHPLADGDKVQFGNPGASILRIRTIAGL